MARITTQADVTSVEEAIQSAIADESTTELQLFGPSYNLPNLHSLTVTLARHIIACLRENPRLHTLYMFSYDLHDDTDVLDVFRNSLPTCTAVTTVLLQGMKFGNDDLDRLRPAFYNTSITKLTLDGNYINSEIAIPIQGQRGGEVLRDLLIGNRTLRELDLHYNPIGPLGWSGLGQGLAVNKQLRTLNLLCCYMGNDGLEHLLSAFGAEMKNNSLAELILETNSIEGADGGQKMTRLLQHLPNLKVLNLENNKLGPLGARALASGLATASHLESLCLRHCWLGNDGVMNVVPIGQINRFLTILDLRDNEENYILGTLRGESVLTLASRCINLTHLVNRGEHQVLSPDQQRRLDLLLDRKRLVNNAQSIAGSAFPILFRAMEEAHRHEYGISAIFVILQNDGEDLFCTALNRAMD